MLLLYLIQVFVSQSLSEGFSPRSTYELLFSDYLYENGIMLQIENVVSRIYCASTCFSEPDCKGFGYDTNKTCSLFNVFIDKDFCSNENCLSRIGIKVYMVILLLLILD